jgi:DNA-binding NarL/FixJ family response regulator
MSMTKRPRVVIADDHTILLEGLRSLLEPHFDLVGTVEDGRKLLGAVEQLKPDVVIVDISMPLLNGIEAARQIRKADSAVKIVMLTQHDDVSFVQEAFRAGASGYVLKRSAAKELVTAVQEVLRGRSYVTPLVTRDLLDSFIPATGETANLGRPLTERQREVLQLVAEGHSIKEIAGILNVSTKTVEFHKYRIMEELGLHTTADLTRYAIKHGIVAM